jgi:hypothetical protein
MHGLSMHPVCLMGTSLLKVYSMEWRKERREEKFLMRCVDLLRRPCFSRSCASSEGVARAAYWWATGPWLVPAFPLLPGGGSQQRNTDGAQEVVRECAGLLAGLGCKQRAGVRPRCEAVAVRGVQPCVNLCASLAQLEGGGRTAHVLAGWRRRHGAASRGVPQAVLQVELRAHLNWRLKASPSALCIPFTREEHDQLPHFFQCLHHLYAGASACLLVSGLA